MSRKYLLLLLPLLSGCGATGIITELAKDPATVSVHQVITAPGWSVTTDYVRNNATGATASAGSNGITANIPAGATAASPPGSASSASSGK